MKNKVRNTSVKSYHSIFDLSRRQADVFDVLQALGTACNMDLSNRLGLPINSVTPRTNELVAGGLVIESHRAVNPATGKQVIYWMVKPEKPIQEVMF